MSHPRRHTAPPLPPYDHTLGVIQNHVRLNALLAVLDRWLDDPVRVQHDAEGHTVWLADAVGYRVDRATRSVTSVFRAGCRLASGDFGVDLVAFLYTPAWLEALMPGTDPADAWVRKAAFRRLRGDPRFRALRRTGLPRALGLDPAVRTLALAIRPLTWHAGLDSRDYTWAWRNEAVLVRARRDAPRLLPLVALGIREGILPDEGDPVAALRVVLDSRRLGPASWRYLLRHGVRWLRPVWEATDPRIRFGTSIEVLAAFAEAGHPAPLPAPDMTAWLNATRLPHQDGALTGIPPAVLSALCAAARQPGLRDAPEWGVEREQVLEWALFAQPRPDKRQRRAGWAWMLRQARAWVSPMPVPPRTSWVTPLARFESGGHCARAIADVASLYAAGAAFRNCLADYDLRCAYGQWYVFVVSELASGRDVAVAAIVRDPGGRGWELSAIRGPCNQEVGVRLQVFGEALAAAFRAECYPEAEPGRGIELVDDAPPEYRVCVLPG